MKIYELISLLEKYPAGAEVKITLTGTLAADLENVDKVDDYEILLAGGDAMVIDENGEEIDWLSNLSERSEDE